MEQPTNKVNVIIADDNEKDLQNIVKAVKANPNYNILKTFNCGNDMMWYCGKNRNAEVKPDIAIIDYEMNSGDGVQTCTYLSHFLKTIPCLAISSHDHPTPIKLMYQAGAKGYIHKSFLQNDLPLPGFGNFSYNHLHTAIDCILAGSCFIDSNFKIINSKVYNTKMNPKDYFNYRAKFLNYLNQKDLSPKEQEIALFKGYGFCTKQIADIVNTNENCVEKSIQVIKRKFGITDPKELPLLLNRYGILLNAEMQYISEIENV